MAISHWRVGPTAALVVALSAASLPAAPLEGGDTAPAEIAANPGKFVGKPIVLFGGVKIASLYALGYADAARTHHCLEFRQFDGLGVPGDFTCALYLARDRPGAKQIIAEVKRAQRKHRQVNFHKLIRVRVTIDVNRFDARNWRLLEVLDAQFAKPGYTGWEPWVVEQHRAKLEEAERQRQQEKRPHDNVAKPPVEAFRTWTDQHGKHQVRARLRDQADGKVRLELQDGRVITVAVERLSVADRQYVAERR